MNMLSGCRDFWDSQRLDWRGVLRAGGLSLVGLTLPDLLAGRTLGDAARVTTGDALGKSFGRAKACILLFMWGGPAQQDTWDPKPNAPAEYRGEFKPIVTSLPGLQVCEHLP